MKRWGALGVGGGAIALYVAAPFAQADDEDDPAIESVGVVRTDATEAPTGPALSASDLGSTWAVPPGSLPSGADVSLADVRAAMEADDPARAAGLAERFAASHKGHERDAALFLVAWLHRERGEHGLAAEGFARVRGNGGPLAAQASWYEAEAELLRGRPGAAVGRCEAYRTTWPAGPKAEDCLQVIARGQAAAGNPALAKAAAIEWDTGHPEERVGEQVSLLSATRRAVKDPAGAVSPLRDLAVSFDAPLTGRIAEQALAQLRDRGIDAALPSDRISRQNRALSLRDSGRQAEAWAAFLSLQADAADDPQARSWTDGQATTFAYRTHHYDDLARLWTEKYDQQPTGDGSWRPIEALSKAGRWTEAAARARVALRDYGGTREVRAHTEEMGRVFLFAKAWDDARATFDKLAARGGSTGRRAEFLAGFAAWLAHDDADAIRRLDAVVAKGRSNELEARYWRSKALDRAGRPDDAAQDRAWILAKAGMTWYGVLLDPGRGSSRDGRFPAAVSVPKPVRPVALLGPPVPGPIASALPKPTSEAFLRATWTGIAAPGPTPSDEAVPVPARSVDHPPPSYVPGLLFDRAKADEILDKAARKGTFPELAIVRDLVSVGLYDLSGPLLAGCYEEWRKAVSFSSNPKHEAAAALGVDGDAWRQLFLLARDHNHTARQWYGVERSLDAADKLDALRIGWPIAHDRFVWAHAREHDIDPYLVLGLMRQESTYNPLAESNVGARGAMQIMPKTGHLIADIEHDAMFTAGDLEDPILSVDYGIRYMGLLMQRFDGAFPLAVASYNGGPHNVGGWLRGAPDVPMDEFVEMIPYRETRNYVKLVTANYATYLALYEPGTALALPRTPRADHVEIVDF